MAQISLVNLISAPLFSLKKREKAFKDSNELNEFLGLIPKVIKMNLIWEDQRKKIKDFHLT
jgi:hypothetical protein